MAATTSPPIKRFRRSKLWYWLIAVSDTHTYFRFVFVNMNYDLLITINRKRSRTVPHIVACMRQTTTTNVGPGSGAT